MPTNVLGGRSMKRSVEEAKEAMRGAGGVDRRHAINSKKSWKRITSLRSFEFCH